ncbi:MAG: amidohydrolase family protein [Alphaproteobacteria bacterium]|nr:amidohydrolase family protein [Alphaproteobacteria bacterium]
MKRFGLCIIVSLLNTAVLADAGKETDLSFVDAHVHLNQSETYLGLMETHHLPKAIVFWGRSSNNLSLIESAKAHPGSLIPFVSISPERRRYRPYWKSDDTALLAELDALLSSGHAKGIGEISVAHFPSRGFPEADFDPLGAMMTGIMRLADRHGVPINIHCEITRLREFSKLLEKFPNVKVIWAHGGYTPYFIAKRMIAQHANLTYELSARTWRNHPRSPDYTIFRNDNDVWPRWLALIEDNPTRFIVGTDASQRSRQSDSRKIESVQRLLRQLSPATRQRVAQDNILDLIGR